MLTFILHGWRSWKNARGLAVLAIAALAAGIGSATAIFTVVEAVLLKPIPWLNGDRYISLFSAQLHNTTRFEWSSTSWPDLLDFQQRTHSFDNFGIYSLREFSLTSPGEPQHLTAVEVTPGFLATLGIRPFMGRWFGQAAAEQGNAHLAVISYSLWQRLGADSAIVGRSLVMDGQQYTVTGVAPGWFRLPVASIGGGEYRTDVWVPLDPQGGQKNRNYAAYFAYARLRPGVSVPQADQDVKRVAASIAAED